MFRQCVVAFNFKQLQIVMLIEGLNHEFGVNLIERGNYCKILKMFLMDNWILKKNIYMYIIFFIYLLLFFSQHVVVRALFVYLETIIPVCPPACGQAIYAATVMPLSSGPLLALAIFVAVILR